MSLINDALKRANLAQHRAPPATQPALELLPAETAPAQGLNLRRLLLVILATAVIAAPACLWWQKRSERPKAPPAAAVPRTPVVLPNVGQRLPAPPAKPPLPVAPKQTPAAPSVAAPALAVSALTPAPTNGTAAAGPATAAVVEAEPPPAEPLPLRLQGIVFHPTRPSVLISGSILFIGDTLDGLRLVAVDRHSATLVGPGRTNILSLP